MPTDISDKLLIKKSQQGDTRAFDMLVMRYQSRLMGLVSRYTRDSSEVEDIVQETFLKAYRGVTRFRGESTFYTWLCRIAINVAKSHFASFSRRQIYFKENDVSQELVSDLYEETTTAEGIIYSDELLGLLQKVLADMSDDLGLALSLRELEGLSYEEISSIMQCPIGTVRSRIFRAREILNGTIKDYIE